MSLTDLSKLASLQPNDVAILGLSFDANSSFLQGPALAPNEIRKQLHCGSANYFSEQGLDLANSSRLHDLGNLDFSKKGWLEFVDLRVSEVLARGARLLSLGGDHSLSWPILRAYSRVFEPLTVLQIDAHADLYDDLEGDRESHACPFARVMEEGLVKRLVQLGVRTLNDHQREQAARFGVEVIEMKDWHATTMPVFDSPLYVSLDLDGLDPAFAPGVSHFEPGGLSTREVLSVIQGLGSVVVGADIVELNPKRDLNGVTAMLAAKLLKELAAKLLICEL